ncbi:hypothetical protein PFNF54_02411 [Plasmodium falciparum NF54]|uniref:Uncharacterized protein n=1 Tax=Plasmodium falciparum (isolate NF54) TaxID=5843 RepID=W7JVU4_PLAFO|nr:hypothetical protein PFNF54_02411 [Plasmodium falciparum NF54]
MYTYDDGEGVIGHFVGFDLHHPSSFPMAFLFQIFFIDLYLFQYMDDDICHHPYHIHVYHSYVFLCQ